MDTYCPPLNKISILTSNTVPFPQDIALPCVVPPVLLSLSVSLKMPSRMRQTAESIIAAFNAMDIPTILAHRSPSCQRIYLPSSMGYPPQDNTSYSQSLQQLKAVFSKFSLTIDDIVEDANARTMCLWLRARADTVAGLYENEYVWLWDSDESGEKLTRSMEFSDSVQNREFYPKLQAAMKTEREK